MGKRNVDNVPRSRILLKSTWKLIPNIEVCKEFIQMYFKTLNEDNLLYIASQAHNVALSN